MIQSRFELLLIFKTKFLIMSQLIPYLIHSSPHAKHSNFSLLHFIHINIKLLSEFKNSFILGNFRLHLRSLQIILVFSFLFLIHFGAIFVGVFALIQRSEFFNNFSSKTQVVFISIEKSTIDVLIAGVKGLSE